MKKKKSLVGWTYQDWKEDFRFLPVGDIQSGVTLPDIAKYKYNWEKFKNIKCKKVRITLEEI